jgi:hypothetical protein
MGEILAVDPPPKPIEDFLLQITIQPPQLNRLRSRATRPCPANKKGVPSDAFLVFKT